MANEKFTREVEIDLEDVIETFDPEDILSELDSDDIIDYLESLGYSVEERTIEEEDDTPLSLEEAVIIKARNQVNPSEYLLNIIRDYFGLTHVSDPEEAIGKLKE